MLRNYLKIAWRNFLRSRFDSTINILGLSIGITGCLLIGLFVWDEFRYDKFVTDGDRIFRMNNEVFAEDEHKFNANVPMIFGPQLKSDFPEVESYTRVLLSSGDRLFRLDEESNLEGRGYLVEGSFLPFFGLPLVEGDLATALEKPNSVVLTKDMARKYFGDESALGRTISIEQEDFTVTGIAAETPQPFHIDFQYLISLSSLLDEIPAERQASWRWQQFFVYIKLMPGVDQAAFATKLPGFAERHAWPQTEPGGFRYVPHLQPLDKIHLYSSEFQHEIAVRGNITHVIGLTIIGVFLLVIAIINFVNLSTARAERRAREVGVRKASGALRSQLIGQFMTEATLLAFLSTVLAVAATYLLLPVLNNFTGKSIELGLDNLPVIAPGLVLFGLIIGFLAGSYPAFVLSSFEPVRVLRKAPAMEGTGRGGGLRKTLIVVQFALTVMLIAASLVLYRQLDYLNSKDLGFNREHVLWFSLDGNTFERSETVKETFAAIPGVTSVTRAYGIPGDVFAGETIRIPGRTQENPTTMFLVDHDYAGTLDLEFLAGRDFSEERPTDTASAFILNETAMREFGFQTPEQAVGQRLEWDMWGRDSVKVGEVIGVVRDFHVASLHQEIAPIVMHIFPDAFVRMMVRIREDQAEATLAAMQKTWDSFDTGYPFHYTFLDESFQQMYEAEARLRTLLLLFTGLTIFVACLGLLGLSIFMAQRRTREIGIRKVLGASTGSLVGLLAFDFLKLVLLAIALATPIAWYFLRDWLDSFAYRISLNPGLFLVAAVLALGIALLTVSFHSIRAALGNPMRSLKSE